MKAADKKDKKTSDRKSAAAAKGSPTEKTEKSSRCAYIGKPGHNILVCFKLIADQAAAKSDGQPGKKIATATTQRTAEDTEEETGSCVTH